MSQNAAPNQSGNLRKKRRPGGTEPPLQAWVVTYFRLIVSTTCVLGFPFAVVTLVKRPVMALRNPPVRAALRGEGEDWKS